MKVGREVRDLRAGGSSHTLDRPEEAADYAYGRILEKRVRLREKTAIENDVFKIAPFAERAEKSARLSGDEAAEKSIARSYPGGRFGESECLRFHSYPDSSSSEDDLESSRVARLGERVVRSHELVDLEPMSD